MERDPCIWASTEVRFIARPQSWASVIFSIVIFPVFIHTQFHHLSRTPIGRRGTDGCSLELAAQLRRLVFARAHDGSPDRNAILDASLKVSPPPRSRIVRPAPVLLDVAGPEGAKCQAFPF